MSTSTGATPEGARIKVEKASGLDRRQFLGGVGGLLLAFTLDGAATRTARAQGSGGSVVNAWVFIGTDESVSILIGGSEMGQGAYSGLAQIAAEQLMVDWPAVRAIPAPAAESWVTGGSSNIRGNFGSMSTAAAAARDMLIAAAAKTWSVPVSTCQAAHGKVTNMVNGKTLTYGQLAALAATLPVPQNPALVPPSKYQLIGKPLLRTDIPSKTNGSAIFGIDVRVPGMVFAVIQHCPVFGGTLQSTPAVPPGAIAVVPLDDAVAVVATNTWQAQQAADQLNANWNIPAASKNIDSAVIQAQANHLMTSGAALVAEKVGDAAAALKAAAKVVDVTYSLPYLAHACMEVLNCTVSVTAKQCDIWAPTQAPSMVLATASALTGLAANQINVHPTFMGGGLGRKFEQDYIAQAIRVGMAIRKPVKLTWFREEDMQHDQYRPMSLNRMRVALNKSGAITGWSSRIVQPSILGQRGWLPPNTVDSQAVDGAIQLSYAFPARYVEWVQHPAAVPVGFWRSVGHSINAFAVESAIDEVAAATGADPYHLRRTLLAGYPRGLAVLDAAAEAATWSTPPPPGRARGIAYSEAFGSIVAQVAEISQPAAGTIQVHSVACAVDCGTAINPDSVAAQMQGAIHHGLSAALWGEVKFSSGSATVNNFSNYRVLLISESPAITVNIVSSGAPLGGVGEPGVPPIAPAVANAYYRLTSKRVRSLPFFPGSRMSDG